MRITAKHEGRCAACGAGLAVGATIEWEKLFGARCLDCATARRYPERANELGQDCYRCRLWVPPRLGVLEPEGEKGWRVRCRDAFGCDMRVHVVGVEGTRPPPRQP